MRYESSVTSLSWIPSEAVTGGTRAAFEGGFTHYDGPPPGEIATPGNTVGELREADAIQMLLDLVIIGAVVRTLLNAAKTGLGRSPE